jgi:hypothetical protein
MRKSLPFDARQAGVAFAVFRPRFLRLISSHLVGIQNRWYRCLVVSQLEFQGQISAARISVTPRIALDKSR